MMPVPTPLLAKEKELEDLSSRKQFYANLIADNSTDCIAVIDANAKTEWVNEAFVSHTGYSLDECIGLSPGEFMVGPETDLEVSKKIASAREAKVPIRVEIKLHKKTGESYWAELTQTPIRDSNGVVTHILSVSRDISVQKKLERDRALAQQKERLRQAERKVLAKTTEWLYAARSLNDLFNVVETCAPKLMPRTNGALYIYSNSRDILDLRACWGGDKPDEQIEADECWALRRGRSYHYGNEEIEFKCEHFGPDVASSFCLPLLAHGETIGMLWCYTKQDEGEKVVKHSRYWDSALMLAEQISLTIANVRLREELQNRSIRDPLTGLWNRRYFLDTIRREAARAHGSDACFSLISIDIDQFKRFNDHHGHDAGDTILKHVANELVATAASSGVVCRVGGEEISVLCRDLAGAKAFALAEKLREAVKRLEIVYNNEVLPCVTVSAGVADYSAPHCSVEEITRNADHALYRAKRTGRDKSVLFKSTDPAVTRSADLSEINR